MQITERKIIMLAYAGLAAVGLILSYHAKGLAGVIAMTLAIITIAISISIFTKILKKINSMEEKIKKLTEEK